MNKTSINQDYIRFLKNLKQRIASSRYQGVISINKELIHLYHYIGSEIISNQKQYGWGAKIIEQLSKDLKSDFADMHGFSPQNLKYMKRFAEEYTMEEISQQAIDQLPWGHNVTLMYSVSDRKERVFYIQKIRDHGWSRNVLSMQIETNLYKREGQAITNFTEKLPSPQSNFAKSLLRNPYVFDFLSLGKDVHEKDVEDALIQHIERFLLELGEGFAFLGRQYYLQIEGQDFYIDLLFYHIKLKAFVVVELKSGKFKPEYAGKMNFYLSAVDTLLRQPDDNPSIGLILCRSEVGVIAEYALRDMNKPIGLAEYRLTGALPEKLKTVLPSIEELEAELSKDIGDKQKFLEQSDY